MPRARRAWLQHAWLRRGCTAPGLSLFTLAGRKRSSHTAGGSALCANCPPPTDPDSICACARLAPRLPLPPPSCPTQAIQLINHEGEVNRARYCPQNPFLLATKTVRCAVLTPRRAC